MPKNKVLRDRAIKAITEEMAKHIVGIGQDDIKKKINLICGVRLMNPFVLAFHCSTVVR